MAVQQLAQFGNDAGTFLITLDNNVVIAELMFPESFSEDDSIQLNLGNLKSVGSRPEEPGTIYEYTCGRNPVKKIQIHLNVNPDIGNFGVFRVQLSGMTVSRGAFDEGYDLLNELNQALQAEAARQVKLKGKNVATLKKTFLASVSEPSKAANALTIPGIGNTVASFLSGKPGTITQQIAALKTNAGVPAPRRRKTRRNRR